VIRSLVIDTMATILLAEDDESVRAFVKRALESDGHQVEPAEDGGRAMEILTRKNGAFDLLLSDIKMPMMDGIALTLNAARNWPKLKIVLMTGFADQRERAYGLDDLVEDIIQKPFTLTEIRQAVGRVLACAAQ